MVFKENYFGFVYIWRDRATSRFYIGSHYGSLDDSYICSSKWMKAAYTKRREDFRRRVLWFLRAPDKKALQKEEQRWLDMINDHHIATSRNVVTGSMRYYNMKKFASGGNGSANKGKSRPAWNKGISKEMLELRKEGKFSLLTDKPKSREPKTQRIRVYVPKTGISPNHMNRKKRVAWNIGIEMTIDQKNKLGLAMRGKSPWNKGKPSEFGAINGKKGAKKLAATVTGRRRSYRENGTWFWVYPEK